MKIGKNAWHAKLNDYVYGNNYSYYSTNLCPYFWGTILAIISLPLVICGKGMNSAIDNTDVHMPSVDLPSVDLPSISDETLTNIGKGLLIVVLGVASVILYYIGEAVSWYNFFLGLGIILGVVGAIVGIILSSIWLQDKYRDWRREHPKPYKPYVEPTPNMLLEYLKAWKHNHCPMLQWVE